VATRHAHLDYILRMVIKSLNGKPLDEALRDTGRVGSRELRKRIKKLARDRLKDHGSLDRLLNTLKECKKITEARNEVMHDIAAVLVDGNGDLLRRSEQHGIKPFHSKKKLLVLAKKLGDMAEQIVEDRLNGYLKTALIERPLSRKT
jgi:hypothetical protein